MSRDSGSTITTGALTSDASGALSREFADIP